MPGMTGIAKQPGPTSRRLAESLRRIRRASDITTAELSRRLTALGQPIPDTSITKAEAGTRRVDVDDLVALALALAVTPNTLLMPPVSYLGTSDVHHLTPAVSDSAEHLWQWAQGERPLRIPGAETWLGNGEYPALEFSVRTRPYLTALYAGGPGAPGAPDPALRALTVAALAALKGGATGAEVRRVIELSIVLPAIMTREEVDAWLRGGPRKNGDES